MSDEFDGPSKEPVVANSNGKHTKDSDEHRSRIESKLNQVLDKLDAVMRKQNEQGRRIDGLHKLYAHLTDEITGRKADTVPAPAFPDHDADETTRP